jgi:hypothetical protein
VAPRPQSLKPRATCISARPPRRAVSGAPGCRARGYFARGNCTHVPVRVQSYFEAGTPLIFHGPYNSWWRSLAPLGTPSGTTGPRLLPFLDRSFQVRAGVRDQVLQPACWIYEFFRWNIKIYIRNLNQAKTSQINATGVPGPLPEDRRCGAHWAIRVEKRFSAAGRSHALSHRRRLDPKLIPGSKLESASQCMQSGGRSQKSNIFQPLSASPVASYTHGDPGLRPRSEVTPPQNL